MSKMFASHKGVLHQTDKYWLTMPQHCKLVAFVQREPLETEPRTEIFEWIKWLSESDRDPYLQTSFSWSEPFWLSYFSVQKAAAMTQSTGRNWSDMTEVGPAWANTYSRTFVHKCKLWNPDEKNNPKINSEQAQIYKKSSLLCFPGYSILNITHRKILYGGKRHLMSLSVGPFLF